MTKVQHKPKNPYTKKDVFTIDLRNVEQYSHSEIYDGQGYLVGKFYSDLVADFFVRACNSHYGLKAAGDRLSRAIETYLSDVGDDRDDAKSIQRRFDQNMIDLKEIEEAILEWESAIAKAEGDAE